MKTLKLHAILIITLIQPPKAHTGWFDDFVD